MDKNILFLRYSTYWYGYLFDRRPNIYAVLTPGEIDRVPGEVRALFRRVYEVSSWDSIEEIAAIAGDLIASGIQIDRIASPTEFTQYAAGYLADLLGVDQSTNSVLLNTRDKRATKARAGAAGVTTPRFMSLPNAGRDADVEEIAARVGFPLVLKPANGWGTLSTTKVGDAAELASLLADYGVHSNLASRHLIAEEFIDGAELHIDAVWRDGEAWVFTVGRYFEPRLDLWLNGGLDGGYLLPEEEHADLYQALRDFQDKINMALGITSGATHLELFIEHGTGRIVLSEIASRLSGANIAELVGRRVGVDLREVWAHELLDGKRDELRFAFGRRYAAMLNLAPTESGRIVGLPDEAALLAEPGVVSVAHIHGIGDLVDVTKPSAWCTLLVFEADTEEELIVAATRLKRAYTVTVEPVRD